MFPVIFNNWDYWELRHKVTFDGVNRIIYVNYGETLIDIQTDVYSAWKEWSQLRDYLKFLPAMRTVGGDPTTGGSTLGATFFLINNWQLKTWEGDHTLTVIGNIYSDDLLPVFLPTTGPYTILIYGQVSNLIDAPASSITTTDVTNIRNSILSDGTSFPGAYIDVALSSRVSQISFDTYQSTQITLNTTVLGGTSTQVQLVLAAADDFYQGMYLQITNAAGTAVRKVDSHIGGVFYVTDPYPFTPILGNSALIIGTVHRDSSGRAS